MGDRRVPQWTEHPSPELGVSGSSLAGPTRLDEIKNLHADLDSGTVVAGLHPASQSASLNPQKFSSNATRPL